MVHRMRGHSGFSLVELMIAMTIGLLLLSGLALIFVNSSDSNRELQKTAQQIENGRYAIDVISQDLRLAGFYGHLHDVSAIPLPATVPPDPCEAASAANLLSALWFPVQGYRGGINPDTIPANVATGTTCDDIGLLTAANLKPGSDVLVVRRADTNYLRRPGDPGPPDPSAPATPGGGDTAVSNVFYIQASSSQAVVQAGNGAAIGTANAADGSASTISLTNGFTPASPAPIRRLRVHIYFVAPCSVGSAANGACTGAAGEDTIPTLKRLELSSSGTITIVPLVEGVEYFKVEFGIDNLPAGVNLATGYIGDATVDSFTADYTATPPDWTTAIAAKVFVLARNTEPTQGFFDDKTYILGAATVPPAVGANRQFKRHVYSAAVHLVNPAGRREIP